MRFTDKVVVITRRGAGHWPPDGGAGVAAEGAALLLIDRSSYVHELAATLAQSGCLVLALRRIWKRGKVPSRRLPPGSLILAVSTC